MQYLRLYEQKCGKPCPAAKLREFWVANTTLLKRVVITYDYTEKEMVEGLERMFQENKYALPLAQVAWWIKKEE